MSVFLSLAVGCLILTRVRSICKLASCYVRLSFVAEPQAFSLKQAIIHRLNSRKHIRERTRKTCSSDGAQFMTTFSPSGAPTLKRSTVGYELSRTVAYCDDKKLIGSLSGQTSQRRETPRETQRSSRRWPVSDENTCSDRDIIDGHCFDVRTITFCIIIPWFAC